MDNMQLPNMKINNNDIVTTVVQTIIYDIYTDDYFDKKNIERQEIFSIQSPCYLLDERSMSSIKNLARSELSLSSSSSSIDINFDFFSN